MKDLISKKEFNELSKVHDQHCVTLYVPTSRVGNGEKEKLSLKNLLKEVQLELVDYGLTNLETEAYLEPVFNLISDNQFWRNQSDCLVIFIQDQVMKHFSLPIRFKPFKYISDHFYLIPIFSLFDQEGKFYLLNLSLQEVVLYECTQFSIAKIQINDLVPGKLEEVVGSDVKSKSIQFRTGQGGHSGAIYHGQGAGKDDKEQELEKFIRAVDEGLFKLLKNEKAPLVLACVDHYYPIFEQLTNYNNLFHKNISGNHENTEILVLHEKARNILKGYFKQQLEVGKEEFNKLLLTKKISIDLSDIVPAAIDGRVEVLFIEGSEDKYGLYDKVNRTLIIEEGTKTGNTSLFNMAAVNTWLNGGQVHIIDKSRLPNKNSPINAILRY